MKYLFILFTSFCFGQFNPVQFYEYGSNKWSFVAEAEYQAVLDKAILSGYQLPTLKERYYQNEMVKALKLAGIWVKLDQLHLWYHSAGFNFSNINFIDPSFVLVRNTSISNSFINKEGARITDTGLHFEGFFNSQTESGNYQLGNASFGYVNGLTDNIDGANSIVKSTLNNQLYFRQHADSKIRQYFQQGEGYFASVAPTASVDKTNKFYISTRTVSNNKIFEDGVKIRDAAITYLGTTGVTASTDVNYTISFGSKGDSNTDTIRMAFTGGDLSETECSDFYTIWNTYKNSI